MPPYHRRKPLPFYVKGRPRPAVLTRPTSPPVYRPSLPVNLETGEIGWSHGDLEEELKDLGLA